MEYILLFNIVRNPQNSTGTYLGSHSTWKGGVRSAKSAIVGFRVGSKNSWSGLGLPSQAQAKRGFGFGLRV